MKLHSFAMLTLVISILVKASHICTYSVTPGRVLFWLPPPASWKETHGDKERRGSSSARKPASAIAQNPCINKDQLPYPESTFQVEQTTTKRDKVKMDSNSECVLRQRPTAVKIYAPFELRPCKPDKTSFTGTRTIRT